MARASAEFELLERQPLRSNRQHAHDEFEAFSRAELFAMTTSVCMVLGLTGIVAWLVFEHVAG
ncbi:hypothetical protein PIIN_01219 [Serendipita indica DSM 11827]|uniref:Uncharacterized protein n=1 Tax=Serendipita indica (strain DSM 11827) TaxID=1109443 RepID=G4T7U2_SERID|nr:hypothetical protein PIIN_01219 [Serendipita indica DSM 11827]